MRICQKCWKRHATVEVGDLHVCGSCSKKVPASVEIPLPAYQAQLRQTPKNLVPEKAIKHD